MWCRYLIIGFISISSHQSPPPPPPPVQSLNDNDGLLASFHCRTGRRLIILILSPARQSWRVKLIHAGEESRDDFSGSLLTLITERERGILQMSQRILFRIGRENENIPFMNFDRIALYSSLNKCYFSFCILCKFLLSLPNVINLSDFTLHQPPSTAQTFQISSL